MKASDIADFYKFLNNEEQKLYNDFVIRTNMLFSSRSFDNLDLLDLIELSAKIEYFQYLRKRLQILFEYLHTNY